MYVGAIWTAVQEEFLAANNYVSLLRDAAPLLTANFQFSISVSAAALLPFATVTYWKRIIKFLLLFDYGSFGSSAKQDKNFKLLKTFTDIAERIRQL